MLTVTKGVWDGMAWSLALLGALLPFSYKGSCKTIIDARHRSKKRA